MASNVQGTTYGSAMLQVKPNQVTAQLALDILPDVDDAEMEGTVWVMTLLDHFYIFVSNLIVVLFQCPVIQESQH